MKAPQKNQSGQPGLRGTGRFWIIDFRPVTSMYLLLCVYFCAAGALSTVVALESAEIALPGVAMLLFELVVRVR